MLRYGLVLMLVFSACTDGPVEVVENPDCESGIRPDSTSCGLNDRGTLNQVCVQGAWQDGTVCTDTDECVDDATFEGATPCGLNARGNLQQVCEVGSWADSSECVDDDVCVDAATQPSVTVCGFADLGTLEEICVGGQWELSANCVEPTCIDDTDCPSGRCFGVCACPEPSDVVADGPWTRSTGAPHLVPTQVSPTADTNYLMADPSAFFDESTSLWRLWFAGKRGTTFSGADTTTIEYAESSDGVSWTVQEVPAMFESAAGAWDSDRTETPDVIYVESAPEARRYVMAYSGGDQVLPLGFHNYKIGLAFSSDGKTFERLPAEESPYAQAGLILRTEDAFPGITGVTGGVVADPTLVYLNGEYHMYFSSFACGDGDTCSDILAFGIGHAVSSDAIHWTIDANNPLVLGGQQPSVSWDPYDCQFEMWYTQHIGDERQSIPSQFSPTMGFWRAHSFDGVNWTTASSREFNWDNSLAAENLGLLTGVDVVRVGRELRLLYVGMTTSSLPSADVLMPVHSWYDSLGYVQGTFGLGYATRVEGQ